MHNPPKLRIEMMVDAADWLDGRDQITMQPVHFWDSYQFVPPQEKGSFFPQKANLKALSIRFRFLDQPLEAPLLWHHSIFPKFRSPHHPQI